MKIELTFFSVTHLLLCLVNADVVMTKKFSSPRGTVVFCQFVSVQHSDEKGAELFIGKLAWIQLQSCKLFLVL